jgi:predicted transposase YbfD/YdcC
LEIAGCIVRIDVIGCLPKIAKQIKDRDGEYVLALKDNQSTLNQDGVDLFPDAEKTELAEWVHDDFWVIDEC